MKDMLAQTMCQSGDWLYPVAMIEGMVTSLRRRDHGGRPAGKRRSPRHDALRRLGLSTIPEINRLAQHAVCVAGGKKRFLDYARTSQHTGLQALIEKYDSLSKSDRAALTITDLCAACNIKFGTVLGEVTNQAFEHNADVSKLMAAVWQPRVVKATIDSALKYLGPDGVKDRQMLLAHSNFLPVPKSASTIFHLQQQINNAREADRREPTVLPSFSSDIIAINAQRRNLQPVGPAATNHESEPAVGTESGVSAGGPRVNSRRLLN
jgi:hypothetical protein